MLQTENKVDLVRVAWFYPCIREYEGQMMYSCHNPFQPSIWTAAYSILYHITVRSKYISLHGLPPHVYSLSDLHDHKKKNHK